MNILIIIKFYHKLTTGQKIIIELRRVLKYQKDLFMPALLNSEWMTKSELQKWMDTNKNYLNKI